MQEKGSGNGFANPIRSFEYIYLEEVLSVRVRDNRTIWSESVDPRPSVVVLLAWKVISSDDVDSLHFPWFPSPRVGKLQSSILL